jgi:hypothetical protein
MDGYLARYAAEAKAVDGDSFDLSDPGGLEWQSRNCHSAFQRRAVRHRLRH